MTPLVTPLVLHFSFSVLSTFPFYLPFAYRLIFGPYFAPLRLYVFKNTSIVPSYVDDTKLYPTICISVLLKRDCDSILLLLTASIPF